MATNPVAGMATTPNRFDPKPRCPRPPHPQILDHFDAARDTEGYQQLPRHLVDAVTAEAVGRYAALRRDLRSLAAIGGESDSD